MMHIAVETVILTKLLKRWTEPEGEHLYLPTYKKGIPSSYGLFYQNYKKYPLWTLPNDFYHTFL